RKFFSSRVRDTSGESKLDPPVTTHRPRSRNSAYLENLESLRRSSSNKANTNTLMKNSSSHNSNRVNKQGLKSRIGVEESTSSVPPAEPVTYSESQWFRIKSSTEDDEGNGRSTDLYYKEPQTFDKVEKEISSSTGFPTSTSSTTTTTAQDQNPYNENLRGPFVSL